MTEERIWTDPDMGKPPADLLEERRRRLDDALAMRRPDRVPIQFAPGFLAAEMAGHPHGVLFSDLDLALDLQLAAAKRFGPDTMNASKGHPGPSEALGDRMTKWPGYGFDEHGSFQFHEHQFMTAADYDAFLFDPSDYAIRTYLPRAFSELEGLAALPPIGMWNFGYYHVPSVGLLGSDEMVRAFEALAEAARRQRAFGEWSARATQRLETEVGIPPVPWRGSLLEAPFDFMSDTLRAMKGIFLDLRQRPEQLLKAQEKAARILVEHAIHFKNATGLTWTTLPLHRGSDGMMSIPQFEKFYWPQLRDMLLQLIDAGITPYVFYEGIWDQRLEYLAELPPGKTAGAFQGTDLAKAKEILGGVMPILGGMPTSLLMSGPDSAIREKTHELCEVVGKGGGYVMQATINEMEGCDPVFIETWVRATREFGTSG
jgi:hypothetical protein